jgi:hypothetical protein
MPTFHLKIKSGSNSSGHYDYVIRDKEKYLKKNHMKKIKKRKKNQ